MEAFSSGFVHKTSRIIEGRSAFPQSHNNSLSIQIKEPELVIDAIRELFICREIYTLRGIFHFSNLRL